MLPFPDLLPEVDQYKFFHDEPLESEHTARIAVVEQENPVLEDDELGPVEFDQIVRLRYVFKKALSCHFDQITF